MPIDVRASQSPDLQEITKISINAPVRVRLHMKDGTLRTEDADVLLTKMLTMLQELSKETGLKDI